MEREERKLQYKRVKELIDDLDVGAMDDCFQDEPKITSKDIIALREKIEKLKGLVLEARNSDEKMDPNYDIEDYEGLFKILVAKFEIFSKKYQCFLEYTDE
ncbi:hypothetical protein Amet_0865 [Alkaliphilus metalliredigens QYMF]|uniref:Uncharacterized protein n=1 Tax=Alkaliphilus metalliredigens (strain QYMF) TaxID=293826 RepID=A6TLM2_ALKMQ|nr:hypothetical protein [Alkaliphilus metalliredigens]ABR47090.1 hypothetical protein Amet_0865 [Alkaliphilus metalliredigens QYMF]